jgi:hypothetical protein
MIDESKVKNFGRGEETSTAPFRWSALPLETLLRYLDEIRQVLPATTLLDMNMEEELILQFQAVRTLQNTILDDISVPANQKAQVANSVASVLGSIADLQNKVYSSERFKRIETLLIRHLNKLPEDVAAAFLEDYEQLVAKV